MSDHDSALEAREDEEGMLLEASDVVEHIGNIRSSLEFVIERLNSTENLITEGGSLEGIVCRAEDVEQMYTSLLRQFAFLNNYLNEGLVSLEGSSEEITSAVEQLLQLTTN